MFEVFVHKDKAYQEFKQKKDFSLRETSLEQVIIKIGEKEFGKLNKTIARLRGEINAERLQGELNVAHHQTKSALMLASVSNSARAGLEFIITPWDKQLKFLGNEDSIKERSPEENNVIVAAPNSTINSKNTSPLSEDSLPDKAKPLLQFFRDIFFHATPLQTAVIFLLVAGGIWYWGEASKTALQINNNTLSEAVVMKDKEIIELKGYEKQVTQALDSKRKNEIELAASVDRVKDLIADTKSLKEEHRNEISELELKLETLRTSYEEKINFESQSLDASTQALLNEKDNRLKENTTNIDSLKSDIEELTKKLEITSDSQNRFEKDNAVLLEKTSRLESSLNSKKSKITELTRIQNNYLLLSDFSANVFSEIERLVKTRRNHKEQIKELKERYNVWFDKNEDKLESIGVPEL